MCNGGNELAKILADSDLLYRLELLDLSHGRMTDAGIQRLTRALNEAPNRLKSLILNDNALTPAGIEAAKKAGLPLTAVDQHEPDSDQYLWNGDIE
jgi:Ran GTPase-activating protein (RanGAP) involved in mRNA processing and transport